MTIEEFALMLSGREIGKEMYAAEEKQAEQLGYVVIFGYSDDGTELRGAVCEEVGSWEGTTLYFDSKGLLLNQCGDDDCPYFKQLKEKAKTIKAVWCAKDQPFAWTYEIDIPHAIFNIFEDGEPFCRGIVFDIKSLEG
jgi:hypothetical protein